MPTLAKPYPIFINLGFQISILPPPLSLLTMIQLLYSVILGEATLILVLLFETPLRKLGISGLDRVKHGRGPVTVKTVASTVAAFFLSSLYSMVKIQARTVEDGLVSPTDQVLMARHMLEASLMGFLLFLALMIDRLHHYIRELCLLKKTMKAAKKQNRASDDAMKARSDKVKGLEDDIATLKLRIQSLEAECEKKGNEVKGAQANIEAQRKKSEEFFLEYDHLLEDNQNLRNQLQSINAILLQSKNT